MSILSAINLSDVDHGGSNLTVTLATSTGGDLSASSGGGVTVGGSGSGTLTLTGTLASLNTFLDTASNVQYLHASAHLNGNDADTISVVVNDLGNTGSGGGADQNLGTVNVDITAVNDDPVITSNGGGPTAAVNVAENSTLVTTVTATDADLPGDTLTYSISGGVDAAKFAINSSTGVLTFATGPDFETPTDVGTDNVYDVTVQVSDGTSTDSQAISVTVTDTPEQVIVGNSSSSLTTGASLTWSHTVGSGDNGYLIVSIAYKSKNTSVTSVTYGGTALTLLGGTTFSGGDDTRAEMWYLKIPATGTDNVVVNLSASSDFVAGATNYYNVDQTTPTGSVVGATGSGGTPSVTVASAANELVIDTLAQRSVTTGTVGAGQAEAFQQSTGGGGTNQWGSSSREAGEASVTMSWNMSGGSEWALAAVALKPHVNVPPTIALPGSVLNYTENNPATIIDATATASDADSANFDTGTLTIDFSANGTANDRLAIRHQGSGGGQIGVSGANVSYGGVTIGTFTGGTGTTPLVITFNTSSNPAAAQALMRNITFENVSESPNELARNVRFVLTDGDGGTSNTATQTINVTAENDAPTVAATGSTLAYTENDGAVAVDSGITVSDVDNGNLSSAIVSVSGAFVTGEDVLAFTNQLGITGSYNAGTGILSLSGVTTVANYQTALRSVTYQNTSENPNTTTRTISFFVDDGVDSSVAATRTISVASISDDPTNAGSLPSDISVSEDVSSNVDLSAIDLSDVDHGGGNLTVTLTTSTGGNLSASSGGGVTVVGSGSGILTLTGTLANLNMYLDTASNVSYLHSTNHLNGNDADTINVVVNDNGNTGTGGGTNQNLGTVNVDISAVNDAPLNTVPGTQTVAEETTTAISGISIGDVDAAAGNLTTRLQVSNGALNVTLSGSASISAGANGSGDLTLQGTVTDLNATLTSLTYTGNIDVVGTAADSLAVTTNDLGNTGSGGGLQDVDNIQIDITTVNDTPVVTGPGSAYAATEQINLTIEGTGFTVSDVDAAAGTMTATIAVGEGAVTVSVGDSGVSISNGSGTSTVTLTGTLSQLDNLLTGAGTGTITYLNSSDTPSASTSLTVTVNDGGNTGVDPGLTGDGSSEEHFASQTINITATNDDPTNAGSLPSDISVTEDVSSNVDLSAINLSDVDHGGGNLTVTLSTSTGGNLSASSGGGVTVGGSGTGTLTLTGTLASLNTFLDTASNVQFLHSTSHLNGDNADAIAVTVNDNGNTGSGGGTNIGLGSVNVDISAVNDAPVHVLPGSRTVVQNGSLTFSTANGSEIEVTDVDAAGSPLQVSLVATNGLMTLSGTTGLSFTLGDGSADSSMTFTGTVTAINSALSGMTYTPTTDYTGTASIQITTDDQGNTGSGGCLE